MAGKIKFVFQGFHTMLRLQEKFEKFLRETSWNPLTRKATHQSEIYGGRLKEFNERDGIRFRHGANERREFGPDFTPS